MDEQQGSNVVEVGVDLSEFYMSVEWDILEVPAVRWVLFYVRNLLGIDSLSHLLLLIQCTYHERAKERFFTSIFDLCIHLKTFHKLLMNFKDSQEIFVDRKDFEEMPKKKFKKTFRYVSQVKCVNLHTSIKFLWCWMSASHSSCHSTMLNIQDKLRSEWATKAIEWFPPSLSSSLSFLRFPEWTIRTSHSREVVEQ